MPDPFTIASLGLTAAGALGGLFGKKKKSEVGTIDTRTDEQKAVSSRLAKILTEGGAPFGGARVADLEPNERLVQNFLRDALNTARPGIDRQLSGEFPEEFFNQAIADPTRQQFNERVAPIIRENSELTGNRFADRSAIELGQARGDVEKGILQERGRFGLETFRDPLNATQGLTSALAGASDIFAIPRTIEQAKLDAQFSEFLRTNPESGGMIDAMLQFTSQSPLAANVGDQEESIFPSLLQAGTSLLGSQSLLKALQGGGTTGTASRLSNVLGSRNSFSPKLSNPFTFGSRFGPGSSLLGSGRSFLGTGRSLRGALAQSGGLPEGIL